MSDLPRPDPDALLQRIQTQDAQARRAKLKIFFGASPGVGKTFAMLVEAHERRRGGTDLVVGVIETHGRGETAALLDGLVVLPRRAVDYKGTRLDEFDLDAALARRPQLILLDELAHTNAPGSRHTRRFQDVLELLDAGIDVYTTLNVQHVESVVDVVAQITGVTVRETVPDSVIDRADVIELVDLPPDDLLERMREGKVYVPEQAQRAAQGFFRKGNLIALRELALRRTAQRVDAQLESHRRAEGIERPWAAGERILVALGDPEQGVKLVRSARRMAAALRADWIVVHVETPARLREAPHERDHIVDVMGLAEDLGAETALVSGLRVSEELLAFARSRNVARIVVGKPRVPRWREWFTGSLVSDLVRGSGDIDVYVIRGEEATVSEAPRSAPAPAPQRRGFAGAAAIVAACTAIAWALNGRLDTSNIAMIYLMGVVLAAVTFGRAPAIAASVLSVAVFDFVFVPPPFTLAVSDTQYVVTFAVMLTVALVIGTLTARMREQTLGARQREQRTAALYQLSRELSGRRDAGELLASAARRIEDVFECRVSILRAGEHGRLSVAAGDPTLFGDVAHEQGVAQWSLDHDQPAGLGTDTLPAARALYLPLRGTAGVMGVLGVSPTDPRGLHAPDRFQLLQTFANQTALALERAQLAEQAQHTRVEIETERLRNALLSSVSHDLRTPLAVITGAASSLRGSADLSAATRAELTDTIADEAHRLNRLVGNLLDMTRLESGALDVKKEWHSVEDVVGAALHRLDAAIGTRPVEMRIPPDLPLAPFDDVLIEQVLVNLIENALKYTPAGTPIEIRAESRPGELELIVADRGPGLPAGGEERVFEKFVRGAPAGDRRGAGLGLTICRGIVEAHGGRIRAENRAGGGAVFRVTLPIEGEPPAVEREPAGIAGEPAEGGRP